MSSFPVNNRPAINGMIVSAIIFMFLHSGFVPPESFRDQQKKFERVRTAYQEKEASVRKAIENKSVDPNHFRILIRVFKKEGELELWAHSISTDTFCLVSTYRVCASSGTIGPKRKEGDGQVPEGFYYVNRFNPASNFYLSLGINYPNESDRILSDHRNPGGDIFIHGNCVTIGCIPITDDKIKEIYVMSVESKTNGGDIPVYIFPCRMHETGMKYLESQRPGDKEQLSFWQNLKEGYDEFEKKKNILHFKVDKNGAYIF